MPVAIADLFISVSADVSAAQAGLTQLGTQLDKTDQQFRAAAPAALVLSAAGAAVATGFGTAVGVAASFEQAMANVRAVMSPQEAVQFGGALGDLAVQLGQQTVFSAREAAAGIGELIKAGISAPDVLNGAGAAALSLAAATGISVANAATIAAQTMNAFHKSASDLTGVVDTLAGVANATAADMSDLQFGLQVVSATAQTMGLSFEDTATAIGVFVSAGETGATAGTGLRQMLLELIPNTKPAKEEMLKLGLATADGGNAFFDAAGHVKNLAQIAGVLQHALRGMSDEQKIAALNTLFTRDAINSATILANQGTSGINAYSDAIGSISAADTAATRLNTLQGALNNLGSSFETVQIIVGGLFLPVLTEIANTARGIVDQFSNLAPEMQRAIVFFGGLGGVVASVLGGMVLLSPVIVSIGPAFAALAGVLVGLAPLFVGIAAVTAVLVAAWQSDLGGVQGIVSDAFSALPDVLDRVGSAFSGAGDLWGNSILPAIQGIGNEIKSKLIPAFELLSLNPVFEQFSNVMQKVFAGNIPGAIDTFIRDIFTISPAVGFALAAVRNRIGEFFNSIDLLFSNLGLVLTQLLVGDISGALNTFRLTLLAELSSLGAVAAAILNLAGTVFPLLGAAAGAVATFWDTQLSPAIQRLGDFLANDVAPAVLNFATNIIPTLETGAVSVMQFWDTQFGPALSRIGGVLVDDVLPKIAVFKDQAVADLITAGTVIKQFFDDQLLPSLSDPGAKLDAFTQAIQNFAAGVQTIGQSGALGSTGTLLADFFGQFDAIKTQVASLEPVFTAIGTFAGALNNLQIAIAGLLARSFGAEISREFQLFGDALANLSVQAGPAAPVIDAIGSSVATLGTALSGVTDFFLNAAAAMNGLATAITNLNSVGPLNLPALPFGLGGQNQPSQSGPQLSPASFNPSAGNGSGPLIQIGTLNIGSEAEKDQFLEDMAAVLLASSRRVTAPPDNSGVPSLSSGVI